MKKTKELIEIKRLIRIINDYKSTDVENFSEIFNKVIFRDGGSLTREYRRLYKKAHRMGLISQEGKKWVSGH